MMLLSLYREIRQKLPSDQWKHPKVDEYWAPVTIHVWRQTLPDAYKRHLAQSYCLTVQLHCSSLSTCRCFFFLTEKGKDQRATPPGASQWREHCGGTRKREWSTEKHQRSTGWRRWSAPCQLELRFTNTYKQDQNTKNKICQHFF